MSVVKCNRCPNFSNEEKIIILNLVKKYSYILECKRTNGVTWREKEEAWIKIEKACNPLIIKHPKEAIKNFYNNKKKATRKQAAAEKLKYTQTGGGPSTCNTTTDPTYDLKMSILNEKTVYGLTNIFDGDDNYTTAATSGHFNSTGEEDIEYTEQVIMDVETDDVNVPDWSNYKTEHLQTPVNQKLRAIEQNNNDKQEMLKSSAEKAWASRRWPALSATMNLARQYEDLVDIKLQANQLPLEILKLEKNQLTWKNEKENEMHEIQKERDTEIHDLKVQSLKLDISIKKKQLDKLSRM